MNLFLDVDRCRLDNEIAPVLLILTAPDQLWIEVAVPAFVCHADRGLFLLLQHRLVLGGWNVLPLGFLVPDRLDGFIALGRLLFRHDAVFPCAARPATRSIILSNSLSIFALKSD